MQTFLEDCPQKKRQLMTLLCTHAVLAETHKKQSPDNCENIVFERTDIIFRDVQNCNYKEMCSTFCSINS
jgi:hypothetical protein